MNADAEFFPRDPAEHSPACAPVFGASDIGPLHHDLFLNDVQSG